MIRVNKYLFLFLFTFLTAGILLAVMSQQLFLFASHTVYYCQSFISSLSLSIPSYIGAIPVFLISLFFIVTVGKLFLTLFKAHRLKSKLLNKSRKDKEFESLLSKMNLLSKAHLVDSNKQFAFCLGIRNPKMYISTGLVNLLTIKELQVVLQHEQYHLENKDTLIAIIASTTQSLVPFFPIISDLLHNYRVKREIMADRHTIEKGGSSELLISILRKLLTTNPITPTYVSAFADEDTFEPRIKALTRKSSYSMRFKSTRLYVSFGSIAIIAILFIVSANAVEIHHNHLDVINLSPQGSACINAFSSSHQ